MHTERYENVKNLLKQSINCTATYGRTGVSHNGVKRICLQHIIHDEKEILDHIWVEDTGTTKLSGHEKVIFDIVLIKRKRPGQNLNDGPLIDVQAKNPVILKIVKR